MPPRSPAGATKAELERFREELLHRYGADADAERVVHVGLQMIPLTSKESES